MVNYLLCYFYCIIASCYKTDGKKDGLFCSPCFLLYWLKKFRNKASRYLVAAHSTQANLTKLLYSHSCTQQHRVSLKRPRPSMCCRLLSCIRNAVCSCSFCRLNKGHSTLNRPNRPTSFSSADVMILCTDCQCV